MNILKTRWVWAVAAAALIVVVAIVLLTTGDDNGGDDGGSSVDYWDGGPDFTGRAVFNIDGELTQAAHNELKACGLADDRAEYVRMAYIDGKQNNEPGDIMISPSVEMVALDDSFVPSEASLYAEAYHSKNGSLDLKAYKRGADDEEPTYLGILNVKIASTGVFEIACRQDP